MKTKITILITLISIFAHSQSWQWGKRGGSIDQLSTTGGDRQEEVYAVVTDSQKNIYTLSAVGMNNLNIDGNVKANFGDTTTLTDVALSSFSCDGTYRWSKIIGGGGYDQVPSLQIDAQDNLYIAGKFATCEWNTSYPPRIDNDFILLQNPKDCSLSFIAKYSSSGSLLWIKRPQQNTSSETSAIVGMSADSLGNSYTLAYLGAGSYCGGALIVTGTDFKYYILKYDANGNFINYQYLDMQLTVSIQFSRNPYNGYYYFSGRRGSASDTAVIAGQSATHAAFIWCFNDLGQLQWLKESSNANVYNTIFWYNYAFDTQNNIYIGGYITGGNYDSFLGLSPSQFNNPPFVMKLNSTADTVIWSSFPTKNGRQTGAIILNGNEVGVTTTCSGSTYTWGTQTFAPGGTNQGTEVLFARLNKDTGACIALNKISGDVGYDDCGTAFAVDASGDYILGGALGHQLTFTTNTITNIGSQSDFFVAKYSTSVCSLSNDDFKEQGMELAPNPVENTVKINTNENLTYIVVDMAGKIIKQGTITSVENSIDVSSLTPGVYILQTNNSEGAIKKVKLVKE